MTLEQIKGLLEAILVLMASVQPTTPQVLKDQINTVSYQAMEFATDQLTQYLNFNIQNPPSSSINNRTIPETGIAIQEPTSTTAIRCETMKYPDGGWRSGIYKFKSSSTIEKSPNKYMDCQEIRVQLPDNDSNYMEDLYPEWK